MYIYLTIIFFLVFQSNILGQNDHHSLAPESSSIQLREFYDKEGNLLLIKDEHGHIWEQYTYHGNHQYQVVLRNIQGGPTVTLDIYDYEALLEDTGELEISVFVDEERTGNLTLKKEIKRKPRQVFYEIDDVFPLGNLDGKFYIKYANQGVTHTILNWVMGYIHRNNGLFKNHGTKNLTLLRLYRKFLKNTKHTTQYNGPMQPLEESIQRNGLYSYHVISAAEICTDPKNPFGTTYVSLRLKYLPEQKHYKILSWESMHYAGSKYDPTSDIDIRTQIQDIEYVEISEQGTVTIQTKGIRKEIGFVFNAGTPIYVRGTPNPFECTLTPEGQIILRRRLSKKVEYVYPKIITYTTELIASA